MINQDALENIIPDSGTKKIISTSLYRSFVLLDTNHRQDIIAAYRLSSLLMFIACIQYDDERVAFRRSVRV